MIDSDTERGAAQQEGSIVKRLLLRRIGIRFLTLHLLLLFLPIGGLIFFDRYEQQLLQQQEEAMAQQSRLVAAFLATTETSREEPVLETVGADALVRFAGSNLSRIRLLNREGALLADTSTPRSGDVVSAGAASSAESADAPKSPTRERLLYRLGAFPFRVARDLVRTTTSRRNYTPSEPPFLDRDEVQAALAGRYGARARTDRERLVLHVALPIAATSSNSHARVVLVSRSTDRIRARVYELRLFLFKIFLASVVLAIVVNLLLAGTIERPLRQLRLEAARLLDHRGRLRGEFSSTERIDEIGDLTRSLRTLASRLQRQQLRTEEFVADLSHELKNPLAAIRAAIDLDADGLDEDEALGSAVALRNVARMERLVSELAELSRIEAGVDDEQQTVDAGRVLLTTSSAWAQQHQRRLTFRIKSAASLLNLDLDPAQPLGPTDSLPSLPLAAQPDHLVRILQNLLDNAHAHSPSESVIDVELRFHESRGPRAGRIVIAVRDRGTGIKSGDEEKIFERFYTRRRSQPDAQLSPQGLGLAVVRALAEAYGGTVSARSLKASDGGGALFEVTLATAVT